MSGDLEFAKDVHAGAVIVQRTCNLSYPRAVADIRALMEYGYSLEKAIKTCRQLAALDQPVSAFVKWLEPKEES